jgi:hypothetical protein
MADFHHVKADSSLKQTITTPSDDYANPDK